MENIFVKVEEREFGPVSIREVKDLVKQGSFAATDYVWSESLDEWVLAEHVAELKSLFEKARNPEEYKGKICAVASGKGGVGKTVLSASLGVGLASVGQEVIMVDADFGGANLHTCMGILEPEFTFFDFYTLQKDTLSDIVLETPVENLQIISGACGTLGLANPKYFQKQRLMRELRRLCADTIILDLGAGASYNIIDFFLLADEKIVVMTPEPTSVYEAFGFIKVCLMRELTHRLKDFPKALEIIASEQINRPGKIRMTVGDLLRQVKHLGEEPAAIFTETLESFKPKLILNMVKDNDEIKEGQAIQAAVLELLCVELSFLGYISYDLEVKKSVKAMKPFLLNNPKSQPAQDLSALIRVSILGKKGFKEIMERRRWRKYLETCARDYPKRDALLDAPICSVKCFYWGDCEYQDGGNPCRVRHLEPVLRESTTSNLAPTPAPGPQKDQSPELVLTKTDAW